MYFFAESPKGLKELAEKEFQRADPFSLSLQQLERATYVFQMRLKLARGSRIFWCFHNPTLERKIFWPNLSLSERSRIVFKREFLLMTLIIRKPICSCWKIITIPSWEKVRLCQLRFWKSKLAKIPIFRNTAFFKYLEFSNNDQV